MDHISLVGRLVYRRRPSVLGASNGGIFAKAGALLAFVLVGSAVIRWARPATSSRPPRRTRQTTTRAVFLSAPDAASCTGLSRSCTALSVKPVPAGQSPWKE